MEWISVKDDLPSIGQYCIITDGEREALSVYHSSGFIRMSGPPLSPVSWKEALLSGKFIDVGHRGEMEFIPDGTVLLGGRFQMEWISVKDGLPDINKDVLILDNRGDMWVAALDKRRDWNAKQDNDSCCNCIMPVFYDSAPSGKERAVSHWMPLPEPPGE